MKYFYLFLKVLFILNMVLLVISINKLNENDRKREIEQYCELVQLWEDSEGENGHPDYKRVADDWCSDNHITK